MSDDPSVIVKWLESPEGENWSRVNHDLLKGTLVEVKEDDSDYPFEAVFIWTRHDATPESIRNSARPGKVSGEILEES